MCGRRARAKSVSIQHSKKSIDHAIALNRRGFPLGWINEEQRPILPTVDEVIRRWQDDQASILPGVLQIQDWQADIGQSEQLMQAVLQSAELVTQLDLPPYPARLGDQFPLLASSLEEHDKQAIEKVYFDALQKSELMAEDLWCKASWLSFLDNDASLRFRFSFGMEGLEDVAADPVRQLWAGKLCDALFPESAILTGDETILSLLQDMLGGAAMFVERIVYFNAPGGGAQMHHDVERGHDGVVFAQLSGRTFWLAISKCRLMDALIDFAAKPSHAMDIAAVLPAQPDQLLLQQLLQDRSALSDYMEETDHECIEAIIDRCPAFIGHLCDLGFAHILHPGDVLFMPQRDLNHCVWHSVCCLDDEPGEALSFAIRKEVNA
ncbi:MAG: hypothetical protein JKY87_04885 [Mariprofundus sp.]|nr:hypothetical protein [Mariprofundus sp.]